MPKSKMTRMKNKPNEKLSDSIDTIFSKAWRGIYWCLCLLVICMLIITWVVYIAMEKKMQKAIEKEMAKHQRQIQRLELDLKEIEIMKKIPCVKAEAENVYIGRMPGELLTITQDKKEEE